MPEFQLLHRTNSQLIRALQTAILLQRLRAMSTKKLFEKKHTAISAQQSAKETSELRPTADRTVGRGLQGQKDQQNDTD
jgi:hypothetical protein